MTEHLKKLLFCFSFVLMLLPCFLFASCTPQKAAEYNISYISGIGGHINGETTQTIESGKNASSVIAIPDEGFRFVKWSDEKSNAERTDKNVVQNLNLVAYFERIACTVTYIAGKGGNIEVEGHTENYTTQSIWFGNETTKVKAIAQYGYRFSRWSDTYPYAERTDKNVIRDFEVTALFEKVTFTVTYHASGNGFYIAYDGDDKIIDKTDITQTVLYGNSAKPIVACMKIAGYKFKCWSDGYPYASREDKNVEYSFDVTAIFEKIVKTFTYEYNNATAENNPESISIDYDNLDTVKFIVPERINSRFEGWYSDKYFQSRISDENGNLLIGKNIFDIESDTLYAKFSLIEEVTYKILMVYVSELEGELLAYTGEMIPINYKMSNIERQLCKKLTVKFSEMLNELFAGLVYFEVDDYFTTQIVDAESFQSASSNGHIYYNLLAYRIPELSKEKLDSYRSVFTTVPLEMHSEEQDKLHSAAGEGMLKYATVSWSYVWSAFDWNFGNALNEDNEFDLNWLKVLSTYLHEFTHTAEHGLPTTSIIMDYHTALGKYYNYPIFIYEELEITELYLLKRLEINGEMIGIPYDWWRDELYLNVTFIEGKGGHIDGTLNQKIRPGRDAEKVTAVPDVGYKFIGWAETFYDEEREPVIWYKNPEFTFPNVTFRDYIFEAVFEEITVDIDYICVFTIDGIRNSEIRYETRTYNDFLSTPLWIPEIEGYEFAGWYLKSNGDGTYSSPIGDEHGILSEEDYKIFDTNRVRLHAKLIKRSE